MHGRGERRSGDKHILKWRLMRMAICGEALPIHRQAGETFLLNRDIPNRDDARIMALSQLIQGHVAANTAIGAEFRAKSHNRVYLGIKDITGQIILRHAITEHSTGHLAFVIHHALMSRNLQVEGGREPCRPGADNPNRLAATLRTRRPVPARLGNVIVTHIAFQQLD
jgi:hypothetical protein